MHNFNELLAKIKFNQDGLVPAIAQQYDSKEVLMMAWMNQKAIIKTISTGQVCYYSRSRKKLWHKGETSGQTQKLVNFLFDCDGDTLLLFVDQKGVACHTGRKSCFYNAWQNESIKEISRPLINPEKLYQNKHK
ncbi:MULTISPECIES: phosphoribosyl-AMP cyclohydrolase [Commensalibacter]|uniref:phosphoribosyl-AMP cyclohydrolase n=1 Tax=Commensalibacter TaxID=1079922 RepID=UPI0018DCFF4F|nr:MULTISPECIES: phosphoribosyl-AMP cyclohydrolase [Commensalibacter]MBH9972646.1 phosphoribosyl-AMP cyclohydrolase [Commensalibacter melissae]MBI0016822.1 phosphoribosyl-AMP cyclohydrolase [Commensalibacter sp. B14384M2]MBI0018567.1 phosphoribosyl-AMP cyclohydrolase [Commensalibacter sp. W8133]MBI0050052.1 phosphoribosyl-AMP cyclohydrolase [Commensalibacter sp. B14384M3]MBI0179236.1 phosphoribosyl-AMP cyclohydrolase [Commensalibacter sp. W8163]